MSKLIAVVRFGNTGTFYYYWTNITDLERGDHVLVDSKNGLGIAKFHDYVKNTTKSVYSWILAKYTDIDIHELRENITNGV